ncbi:unnamed protein product, partial [Oppiella nova]
MISTTSTLVFLLLVSTHLYSVSAQCDINHVRAFMNAVFCVDCKDSTGKREVLAYKECVTKELPKCTQELVDVAKNNPDNCQAKVMEKMVQLNQTFTDEDRMHKLGYINIVAHTSEHLESTGRIIMTEKVDLSPHLSHTLIRVTQLGLPYGNNSCYFIR